MKWREEGKKNHITRGEKKKIYRFLVFIKVIQITRQDWVSGEEVYVLGDESSVQESPIRVLTSFLWWMMNNNNDTREN